MRELYDSLEKFPKDHARSAIREGMMEAEKLIAMRHIQKKNIFVFVGSKRSFYFFKESN